MLSFCSCVCLCKEQHEERLQLMEDEVTCNRMINELESGLLGRLTSTYQCIIEDAVFVSGLAEIKVRCNVITYNAI